MTKAKIIEYLYDNHVRADITLEEMADDLSVEPSAQLAQNLAKGCTDTISRWEAINLIERMKPYQQDADDIAEMIHNMPSAQLTPCDMCRHNPPSSGDGKPCAVCPAGGSR